jgi:hypothetical protein
MGHIVLYKDKKNGIRLTLSNDCKIITLHDYIQNTSKTITIFELMVMLGYQIDKSLINKQNRDIRVKKKNRQNKPTTETINSQSPHA